MAESAAPPAVKAVEPALVEEIRDGVVQIGDFLRFFPELEQSINRLNKIEAIKALTRLVPDYPNLRQVLEVLIAEVFQIVPARAAAAPSAPIPVPVPVKISSFLPPPPVPPPAPAALPPTPPAVGPTPGALNLGVFASTEQKSATIRVMRVPNTTEMKTGVTAAGKPWSRWKFNITDEIGLTETVTVWSAADNAKFPEGRWMDIRNIGNLMNSKTNKLEIKIFPSTTVQVLPGA